MSLRLYLTAPCRTSVVYVFPHAVKPVDRIWLNAASQGPILLRSKRGLALIRSSTVLSGRYDEILRCTCIVDHLSETTPRHQSFING